MSEEPQLFERRAAYESLSNHLTQLPRKLTHPGLIPIAPRLYLPGQLIRTNEILVLLGRSGETSYFAERSAWQAHQIVRRRLGHIEQGLGELLEGGEQVNTTAPSASKRKKRVTFREPVVCASPAVNSDLRPSSTSSQRHFPTDNGDSDRGTPSEPAEDIIVPEKAQPGVNDDLSTTLEGPNAPLSRKELISRNGGSGTLNHSFNPVAKIPQEYMDVLRAAEQDEDSSDDEIDGEHLQSLTGDSCQELTNVFNGGEAFARSAAPKSRLESELHNISSEMSVKSRSQDTEPGDETTGGEEDSDVKRGRESEQQSVRQQFQNALRNAERQAEQEGVVNLMEFYENEADLPSRVNLPRHFRPDETIDFGGDTEEYLDVTGESTKATGNTPSTPSHHLEFLREEARKEEEEERRNAAEKDLSDSDKRRNNLEREKKEFGAGFAKGFFGAPSKSNTAFTEHSEKDIPAPRVTNPEVSNTQETGAVQERVVERIPSRKTSRRHRKPRMTVFPEVMSVAASQQEPSVPEDERAGQFARIEDVSETEDAHMSKFRQLRKLKRASVDATDR